MDIVNVTSLDQEKKVFRVVISKGSVPADYGTYRVNIPYPTDITNTNDYGQCVIHLDRIVIGCESNNAAAVTRAPNPVWTFFMNPGQNTLDAVVLNINLPSRQTTHSKTEILAGTETEINYKYQELIPLQAHFRGNYLGIEPGPGAGAGASAMRSESTPIVKKGPFQMKYNKSSFPFKGSPAKDMKTGKYKQKFEN